MRTYYAEIRDGRFGTALIVRSSVEAMQNANCYDHITVRAENITDAHRVAASKALNYGGRVLADDLEREGVHPGDAATLMGTEE